MKLTVWCTIWSILANTFGLLLASFSVSGFSRASSIIVSQNHQYHARRARLSMQPPASSSSSPHLLENDDVVQGGRRAVLQTAWTATAAATAVAAFSSSIVLLGPAASAGADTGAEVRGTPVTAFNGLTFQYRGNDFDGLRAADLQEPSISYSDFVQKLKTGGVTLVEFFAPDGDVAYATLQADGTRIRIGEGYPIERHDGYSSPAFAMRTVKNAGVPYKFVVPTLTRK